MNILITGASGFVGGSFMRWAERHPDVCVHGIGRRKLAMANYTSCDLTKPLELEQTPDVIIHAAARSAPWGSLQEFRRQNVTATENVVDFCVRKGVKHLIYISSSSVFYREADQEGMTEETPIGPDFVNHYARTKYEGELAARKFPGRVVVLRPRAVFGEGDTVLFPRILAAARAGRMYRFLREGPPVRGDLIHIGSLCDYMLRAALDPRIEGDFNLTNDAPVEIGPFLWEIFGRLGIALPDKTMTCENALKLATAIEWVYKIMMPCKEPPITRFGIGVLAYSKTFDASKTLRVLGRPAVSLEDGVEAFIRWQKQQMP
ncbi:MAG: NAD(P)-dependent oxidoreductase [Akkermansiaceae bacterium]|nr:NAD(P)-dependent oxidoreductase [Akkermansiaceae bacterium]